MAFIFIHRLAGAGQSVDTMGGQRAIIVRAETGQATVKLLVLGVKVDTTWAKVDHQELE
jgi:hypothetical protein